VFFVALATDYDGTLAHNGRVDAATVEGLKEVKRSGRKLILVTGRDLPDLQRAFPELELFDLVVAENGALLFNPAKKEETALAEPPSAAFVQRLQDLGVSPLAVGRTIVATWEPNQTVVLQAIHDLALELHIIFNKGAVMVLPSNINKAWGLRRALKRLCLSQHNVVGIGDAENDQAFLSACGCAVAVENALPSVKAKADLIVADHGAGVVELARLLTETDLRLPEARVPRRQPLLGVRADGSTLSLSPFETTLITGSSGAGKSTIVTALLEQMRDLSFQFCVVDPEGDYSELPDAVVVGDARQEPRMSEVKGLLAKPDVSSVVNLLAIDAAERPRFLARFLPEIAKLRAETGRPHWIVIDETHHCLPAKWDPAPITLPKHLPAAIAVTVHPEEISRDFLEAVSTVVGVGDGSLAAIAKFCRATGRDPPRTDLPHLEQDQVHVWTRGGGIEVVTVTKPKERQKRHARKYAEGELGEDRSFYFRGPEAALNLRAQNLSTFLQMAVGVDDKTWLHHLRAGEYSRWFRQAIKDDDLASEAQAVESDNSLSARDSRSRIKEMIDRRYTAPSKAD
jgi:hydroxymethylpyrimidine pyrophosphatase-like HAD family hydrolase/energy-coupling factor transporter ATP-binding protein EcfA2